MTVSTRRRLGIGDIEQLVRARALCTNGEARQLRLKARLSQLEVAAAVGTTPSAVSRWEAGLRMPKGRPGRRYAEILDSLADGEEVN